MNKKSTYFVLVGVLLLGWVWRTARTNPPPAVQSTLPTVKPAQPRGQIAQPTTTNIPGIGPVPTDPRELERFKAKAKREMQTALRTVGVFSEREDMKQAQDNGELAWIYIEQRKNLQQAMDHIHGAVVEPYVPRTLAALEHILKHAEDGQLKLTAATLLYRYGQPAGKEYLLSVLNSPVTDLLTRDALLTLAKNQEPEAVPGIVAAFPKTGSPYDATLLALGRWADPGIAQVIQQRYASDRKNWGYAMALSQAGDSASIAPLNVALDRLRGSSDGHRIISALARVGSAEHSTWAATMETAWQNRARLSEQALLSYLDIAGPGIARAVAQDMLKACIPLHEAYVAGMESQAKGIREKIPELSNKFPKPPPSEFIMGAAQLLAQWEAKEAIPTLQQVLATVQQGNRGNVYVNEALGLALYKLDPMNWRETLLNAGVPEYHVDRIPELSKLRPIPPQYLPKQVNLKQR